MCEYYIFYKQFKYLNISLSDKHDPLQKSRVTQTPLCLWQAAEEEVLTLAALKRLWRLYSWTDIPPQTLELRDDEQSSLKYNYSDNVNNCMNINRNVIPSTA